MCDTLIVYEAQGDKEVQIVSHSIHCDSRLMRNPCSLPVSVPATSLRLQPGHRYRYCIVLMVPSLVYDELSLGLGCSDIVDLEETLHLIPADEQQQQLHGLQSIRPEISSLHVNASGDSYLKVRVCCRAVSATFRVTPSFCSKQVEVMMSSHTREGCQIDLDVFAAESGQVHRKRLNCSSALTTLSGLLPGHYRVCASVDDESVGKRTIDRTRPRQNRARCVEVQTLRQNNDLLLLLLLTALFCLLALVAYLLARILINKRTNKQLQVPSPPQCFVPAQQLEITHKAHYIKLHATTKV